jgi:hypothetical protein
MTPGVLKSVRLQTCYSKAQNTIEHNDKGRSGAKFIRAVCFKIV